VSSIIGFKKNTNFTWSDQENRNAPFFFKWGEHHRELKKIKQDGYILNERQTMMFEKIYKTRINGFEL